MKKNERGGIISNLILIPAGVALMAGFFLLGYYVGRYQAKQATPGENLPPLPDVVSKNLPKPEDFTFYKTLTGKDNKTVSIDLKPKTPDSDAKAEKKQAVEAESTKAQHPAEKNREAGIEKKAAPSEPAKQKTVKTQVAQEKKVALAKPASSKIRYTIQVSSHQDRDSAEQDVKRLKQDGFAAFVVASEVSGKGKWFRVRVGSFTNKESAEKLQKDIRAKLGSETIVTLE